MNCWNNFLSFLECPLCYGLIENSVLAVRKEIFEIQVEISKLVSSSSMTKIQPFYQAITSMQASILNMTIQANSSKLSLSGLDLLWKTLADKINVFFNTLQGSTMTKMNILLNEANAIFIIHNMTVYQYSAIYRFLIVSYNIVHNTVRARLQQQTVALNELNKLAAEMTKYVTTVTTTSNTVLTKRYDLVQKIRISINAAKRAAESALIIRNRAIALPSVLSPVYTTALSVQKYATTCIDSIDAWLINATSTLGFAQSILTNINIAIPDHAAVILFSHSGAHDEI